VSEQKQVPLEAKVGAFVVALLGIGALLVFLLGSRRGVFEEQVVVQALFKDVGGLREGAQVRLAGVVSGSVSRIDFVEQKSGIMVRTVMHINRTRFPLVRADSMARIDAQGLLGDKIIEISVGSKASPPLAEGATLRTQQMPDISQLMSQSSEVLEELKRVANAATRAFETFTDPQVAEDLRASFSSLRALMEAAVHGHGLAHALFYDKESAAIVNQLGTSLDTLVGHIDRAVDQVARLLSAVDSDGMQVLNNISRAARSIDHTASDLNQSRMLPDLERAVADLSAMMRSVRAGNGTLGALVTDNTAYEQLVTVLGGVERSRVLRALVRWAITKDEGSHAARTIEDPKNSRPNAPKR
jgi:phospholipid/cholesterol/gamma-HCH transport system substrate-binding protein